MPFAGVSGGRWATDTNGLTFSSFMAFNYPKIRFNNNEWYVATAYNQNRSLNQGWTSGPSPGDSSLYLGGQYHPGEDWNRTGDKGNDPWPTGDLGAPLYAIADGVVLYSGEAVLSVE